MSTGLQLDNIGKARRNFFNILPGKVIGFVHEMMGIQQMKLNSLHKLPDEVIEKVIPVLVTDGPYKIKTNLLLKYNKVNQLHEKVKVFTIQEKFIIDTFNGKNTIREISFEYARKFELTKEKAYMDVKSFFIELAEKMVFIPKDAHDENE
jgi:hypothetical protein